MSPAKRKPGRPATRPAARVLIHVEADSASERQEWADFASRQQIDGRNVRGLGPFLAHLMRERIRESR